MSHIYPCFVTNICHYFDLLDFVYYSMHLVEKFMQMHSIMCL